MKRQVFAGLHAVAAACAVAVMAGCSSGDFVIARVVSAGGSGGSSASVEAGASGEGGGTAAHCSGNVLFVVGSDALTSGDSALLDRLRGLGWEVSIIEASLVTTDDAQSADFVFISRSIRSPQINASFRDLATPLFVTEHGLYASLGMTGNAADASGVDTLSVTDLTIADPTHPLAAGFSGTVSILTPGKGQYGFGVPGGDAVVVANLVDESKGAAIFGYEQGTAMVGLVAPARRVGWFLDIQASTRLTADGWAMFDAAMQWTAGPCATR